MIIRTNTSHARIEEEGRMYKLCGTRGQKEEDGKWPSMMSGWREREVEERGTQCDYQDQHKPCTHRGGGENVQTVWDKGAEGGGRKMALHDEWVARERGRGEGEG